MGELADRLGQFVCAIGTVLGVTWMLAVGGMAVLRGVLVCLLLVVVVSMTPAVASPTWQASQLAPWLQEMQQRHTFAEFVPMSAKNAKDIERMLGICEKYLPEQPWWHAEDELTDRSEKFLASEMVREKLFRLTGDELPYTSTVVIDKFEEEAGRTAKRMLRIAATIVVEREGHKAMVIGDKGEKLKRIGTETRMELEKLLDAKVFIELWVKVRSGWADDEARVRSFGYE